MSRSELVDAMADDPTAQADRLAAMLLQHEVEQFFYREAALLDDHAYDEWTSLLADDVRYFMPIRRTRLRRERHREFTEPGEMAYFDDDKMMLLARATKYLSGSSWSEDPPSRSRHLITNVRVVGSEGDEISTSSNFHVYRSRYRGETDSWVGRREDVLRRDADSFVIARRTIYLDQTVLQSANLTTLF